MVGLWVAVGVMTLSMAVHPGFRSIAQSLATAPAPNVQYRPPSVFHRGAPMYGRQRGGGSRGDCPAVNQPLTALVPANPSGREPSSEPMLRQAEVWGQTTNPYPTFWFYVPYALSPDLPAEFVLRQGEQDVYRTELTQSSRSDGLIRIDLPNTAQPLAVNMPYQWILSVYCESDDPIFTSGWIQRITVDETLAQLLQQASPAQKVQLYAEQGIWFDALTALAELRTSQPHNRELALEWAALLESADLQDMADKPIVQ